jgi:hypothetical protein
VRSSGAKRMETRFLSPRKRVFLQSISLPAPNIGMGFRTQPAWNARFSNPYRPCHPHHPKPFFLSRASQSPMLRW